MKKLMLAIAGAVAIGASAVAGDTAWFNQGTLSGWNSIPASTKATALAGDNAGTWSVDSSSDKTLNLAIDTTTGVAKYEDSVLKINTDGDELKLTGTAKTLDGETSETDSLTFTAALTFNSYDYVPAMPSDAKAGIALVSDGSSSYFYVAEADGDSSTAQSNVWHKITGVTGEDDTKYNITVTVYTNDASGAKISPVAYTIANADNTSVLATYEGSIWNGVVSSDEDPSFSEVVLSGTTSLSSITTKSSFEAREVSFSVGNAENADLTTVKKLNGDDVTYNEGSYWAQPGTQVRITYTANDNYLFTNGLSTITFDYSVVDEGEFNPADVGGDAQEAQAKIGTALYLTFADAVTAVQDNEEIVLLADGESEDLTLSKVATVNVNGYTLTVIGNNAITANLTVSNNLDATTGGAKFASNAGFSIGAGVTLDMSTMNWGDGGLVIDSEATNCGFDLTATSIVKIGGSPDYKSPNWMNANMAEFFQNTSGAKVFVGSTEYTCDGTIWTKSGDTCYVEITAKSAAGTDMDYDETYATIAAAITAADDQTKVITLLVDSEEEVVLADEKILKLAKNGKTYLDSNVTTEVEGKSVSAVESEGVTTYSLTANVYTVSFFADSEAETAYATQQVAHGNKVAEQAAPEARTGYNFTGWDPDTNTVITAATSFYGQWAAIEYTITVPGTIEGGAVTADKSTATMGETVTLTVTPDANYEIEWVKTNGVELAAVEKAYSFVMPAENVAVTAQFKSAAVSYTVTYSINAVKKESESVVSGNSPTSIPGDAKLFTGGTWDSPAPAGAVITCDTNFNYTISGGSVPYADETKAKEAADNINNASGAQKAALIADPVPGISSTDKETYAGYVKAVQDGSSIKLELNLDGATELTNEVTAAVTNINISAVASGTASTAEVKEPIVGMWYNMAAGSQPGSLTAPEANATQATGSNEIKFTVEKSGDAHFYSVKAGIRKEDVVNEDAE